MQVLDVISIFSQDKESIAKVLQLLADEEREDETEDLPPALNNLTPEEWHKQVLKNEKPLIKTV